METRATSSWTPAAAPAPGFSFSPNHFICHLVQNREWVTCVLEARRAEDSECEVQSTVGAVRHPQITLSPAPARTYEWGCMGVSQAGCVPGIDPLSTPVPGTLESRPRNRPVLWTDQVEGDAHLDMDHRTGIFWLADHMPLLAF